MIDLIHKSLPSIRNSISLNSIINVDDLINRIKTSAKAFNVDQEKIFKGDMFEIFIEFLIKKLGSSNQIGVVDYSPAQVLKDYGVDGVGIGLDGTPATLQMKFRSNPTEDVIYEEVSKFFFQSYTGYKVTNHIQNLLIFTTAFNMNQHAKNNYMGRFFGLNEIKKIVGEVNPPFWKEFEDSFLNSQPLATRQLKQRFSHQQRMIDAGTQLIDSDEEKGWIGCGTGGGKTLVLNDLTEYYLSKYNVVVIASPRIMLTEQIKKELHENKTIDYERLLFHSGGKEEMMFFKGDITKLQNSTTDENVVEYTLNNLQDRKIVIFTTYHSTSKVASVLDKMNLKYLYLADECHNLVSAEWGSILDRNDKGIKYNKFIGVTATGKSTRYEDGFGMNHPHIWGRCICEIKPIELMQAGIVVPPRAYIMKVKDKSEAGDNSFEIDAVRKMVRNFKDEICFNKSCKIIVICSGTKVAHDMVDEGLLNEALPEFEKFVVTSSDRMRSRSRESELQRFKEAKDAIICHYDMLGEGISVDDVDGILPLRSLNSIKAIQNAGRAGRLTKEDREMIRKGELTAENRSEWQKPYGWILCPYLENEPYSSSAYKVTLKILSEIRSNDYNFCLEEYMYVSDSTGDGSEKDSGTDYDKNLKKDIEQSIIKDLEILQEDEEKVLENLKKASTKTLVEVQYSVPDNDKEYLGEQDKLYGDAFNF